MWHIFIRYKVFLPVVLLASYSIGKCDAISNTSFNASLRDYSANEVNNNTHVKTLQKEAIGKHAYYAPAGTPIKFKEIPDSAISSSSNGRDLVLHDHPGYVLNDYEEGPLYDLGHDYHFHNPHHELHSPHNYEHQNYDPYHYGSHHHFDHGHYKHHKHALATKAVLWPLAGIALLGAAAALVSNPVLLQLGVISGKRRRRDTKEITGTDFSTDIKNYGDKIKKFNNEAKGNIRKPIQNNFKRRVLKTNNAKIENPYKQNIETKVSRTTNRGSVKLSTGTKRLHSSFLSSVGQTTVTPGQYENYSDDDKFIPIAIKLRSPNISGS